VISLSAAGDYTTIKDANVQYNAFTIIAPATADISATTAVTFDKPLGEDAVFTFPVMSSDGASTLASWLFLEFPSDWAITTGASATGGTCTLFLVMNAVLCKAPAN
jgi:hypothetical protein